MQSIRSLGWYVKLNFTRVAVYVQAILCTKALISWAKYAIDEDTEIISYPVYTVAKKSM